MFNKMRINIPEINNMFQERSNISSLVIQGLLILGIVVGVAYVVEH